MGNGREDVREALVAALPKLRRFAYALTGTPHEADDLLQASVERALAKSDQYRPGTNFEGWLFRICRNLWIDEMRSRQTRKESAPFDEEVAPPAGAPDSERAMQASLDLDKVRSAMASLNEDHRAVLALVGVEGLSYKEAAAVLDLPVGTVMSRLSRARAQLAADMGG